MNNKTEENKKEKPKKYDFFFSRTALNNIVSAWEKEGGEKVRRFWRGYEFTFMVEHKREFDPFWDDYEYVGTGIGDEISAEKISKKDVREVVGGND